MYGFSPCSYSCMVLILANYIVFHSNCKSARDEGILIADGILELRIMHEYENISYIASYYAKKVTR